MICKTIEEKKPNFLFFSQHQRNKTFNERRPFAALFLPLIFSHFIHDDALLRCYLCER